MNLEINSLKLSVKGVIELLKNYTNMLDCEYCPTCPLDKEIEIADGEGKTIKKRICWILENIQDELNKKGIDKDETQ